MFFLCWAPEVCDKRGVIRVFSLLSPGSLRQAGRNSCFFSAEPRKFPTSGAKSTFFFYYVPKIKPSAMSHAIHKIVSIKRCQSYFISRRSPHLGISKDSESCASAHRCLHYAYARLIARVTFHLQCNIIHLFPFEKNPPFWKFAICCLMETNGRIQLSNKTDGRQW